MVCIDITELVNVNFISGIQRVVKEVTTRWIQKEKDIRLLVYNFREKCFYIVDNYKFQIYYSHGRGKKNFLTNKTMKIIDFNESHIFYDMDSVWMNPLKRSYLLPLLKSRGVKIAAHIYDIIPVTEAQYCHEFTVYSFMEYLYSQILYSDLIISNAQATINAINCLIEDTDVKMINGRVVKLGSDIKKNNHLDEVKTEIVNAVGKGKYILMVGTIEPRKNHKFVLQAFDKYLFDDGVHLILAGRIGWNVFELMEYINHHKELNNKLFYFRDATDQDITYLYENALAVAFPSFNEGFGLPIIEAFERGTPVLASDIPVLREVGKDYCKYFSLNDSQEFVKLVRTYIMNEEIYLNDKEKIKTYRSETWDECAEKMWHELCQLEFRG